MTLKTRLAKLEARTPSEARGYQVFIHDADEPGEYTQMVRGLKVRYPESYLRRLEAEGWQLIVVVYQSATSWWAAHPQPAF